jgi:cell wall-active antibiotic response 4TMS protein YvqF
MNSPTSFPPAAVRLAHPTLEAHLVPERRGAVAILSNTRRDADWILPRLFRVFTFWGNTELDLTNVLLGPGTSVIDIRCIMGNVEIRVPPDLRVESEVDAVLGSAEVRREISSTTTPDAPTVRITGTTVLGSIEIKVIDPNRPTFGERIRRRIRGRGNAESLSQER